MNELQESILESINILSEFNVNTSAKTLTIEGLITEIKDSGLGIYTVEYMGNQFTVHSSSSDIKYSINDKVYILIPNGDFSKEKLILGYIMPTVNKQESLNNEDLYIKVSDNLLINENYNLCSYRAETKEVYPVPARFSDIFTGYLKDYKTFSLSLNIRTILPKEQQSHGNYGVKLTLPFIVKDKEVEQTIIFDVDKMIGNPYSFIEETNQILYFTVDDSYEYNISKRPAVKIFCSDFIQQDNKPDDIFISNISLYAVDEIPEENLKGYNLQVTATGGSIFTSSADKTLVPILKLNGKEINIDKSDCYWFVEDSSINVDSNDYSTRGGIGWKCLNRKTNIIYNSEGREVYEYATNDYSYIVKSNDVKISLRYKCVIIYDNNIISKRIELKQLQPEAQFDLSIVGSPVKNIGNVAIISDIQYLPFTTENNSNIIYEWMRFDKNKEYIDNNFYTMTEYNKVENNHFITKINYPLNIIDEINYIQCSAYFVENGEMILLGTKIVKVSPVENSVYRLTIQNNNVIFKYDADGNSPMTANYSGPEDSVIKEINPIRFKFFKQNGDELTEQEYQYCDITWKVSKNSMISIDRKIIENEDENYYYVNAFELPYSISLIYDNNKNDNDILLAVKFNDIEISNVANVRFIKDGESGTNGTKYAAVITYNGYAFNEKDNNGELQKLNFVYIKNLGWRRYENENMVALDSARKALDIEVYSNGQKINTGYTVTWSMFDSSITKPCFSINSKTGEISSSATSWANSSEVYCNIVQAKVVINDGGKNKETLYSYYPIEITYLSVYNSSSKLLPSLKGGFHSVLYAADGTNPRYVTDNFEVIDNYNVDKITDNYTYYWSMSDNLSINSYQSSSLPENKKNIIPINKYDNGKTNNYVKVSLSPNSEKIKELQEEASVAAIQFGNTKVVWEQNLLLMNNFLSTFKYSRWKQLLDNGNKFLANKEKAKNNLQIVKTNLEDLFNYCNDLEVDISSIFNYKDLKQNNLQKINSVNSYISNIKNLETLDEYILNGSIGNLVITIGDNQKASIKELIGASLYSALYTYVLTYNQNIYLYQDTYNDFKIKQTTYNEYINSYNTIAVEFADMVSKMALNTNDNGYQTLRKNLSVLNSSLQNKSVTATIVSNTLEKANKYVAVYGDITDNGAIMNQATKDSYKEKIDKASEDQSDAAYAAAALLGSINENSDAIVHIRPIVMRYNTYGMSNFNAWDGNKIYTGINDEYLLAPQVGAGKKEDDNTFTGILIGLRNDGASGLFGYSKGIQSIFLDAETGKSEFGKSGAGQIIIDPSTNQAVIKSGNYSTTNKTGMQINLTEPNITFGSERFKVDKDGKLTASDATISGSIIVEKGSSVAGWNITEDSIYKEGTGLSSNQEKYAFWAGESNDKIGSSDSNAVFRVGHDGSLTATQASIEGKIIVSEGEIGGFKITEKGLYKGTFFEPGVLGEGILIGTDRIIVRKVDGKINTVEIGDGKLKANACEITGGSIGYFTIDSNLLYAHGAYITEDGTKYYGLELDGREGSICSWMHKTFDSQETGFFLGDKGLSIGSKFKFGMNDGQMGDFKIHSNGYLYTETTAGGSRYRTFIQKATDPNTWVFSTQKDGYGKFYVTADGICASPSFINNSSIRYKENIRKLSDKLSGKIDLLNLYEFDYKGREGLKNQCGMIAEEVENIFPDAVQYNEYGFVEGINYTYFIPLLIQEINKLKKEIKEIKDER